MASTLNISPILNSISTKQNLGIVSFHDFCDYMYRYVKKRAEENSDFAIYLDDLQTFLKKDLQELAQKGEVFLIAPDEPRMAIVIVSYYVEKYTTIYKSIDDNPAIPFPILDELPKRVPREFLAKQTAGDFIQAALEKKIKDDGSLYCLEFPKAVAPILFPSKISVQLLLDAALAKIQALLTKEEAHDYFLKKLIVANQGKELTINNFFDQFMQSPKDAVTSLKGNGDAFYYWSQLCFFIKQDYEKSKDYDQKDVSILQSVYIAEYATSFFKTQTQANMQRDLAFKQLDSTFLKPPYYFTFREIAKFLDAKGVPLLGQYTEQELKDYLHLITTDAPENALPRLLVFRTNADQHYFILKDKVIPLIVRLCSDARVTVREKMTNEWFATLKRFQQLPEMKSQAAFEQKLEQEIDLASPVLFALLKSPFLQSIHLEMQQNQAPSSELVNLFINGELIPYSEILMMSRQELLADAKIKLPVWYSIPVVSWFMSLLFKPPKPKTKKKTVKEKIKDKEKKNEENAEYAKIEAKAAASDKQNPKLSRARELRASAQYAETQLVPSSSTIDRELESYIHEWNQLIDKTAHDNLVEDINSLIRDYMRKVLRTLKSDGFTLERIQNLADTLVKSHSMQKIHNHDALFMYVQLYMIKLVKSIPN